MAVDRNALRINAKYCEESNRYADMVEVVRELVTSLPEGENLTDEERNLLAVAYKFEVGARRRSLRAIHKIHDTSKLEAWKKPILNERMTVIIKEQIVLCKDLIALLDKHLIPIVDEEESDIFYHKLKADYCRYLAEIEENPDKASELIQTAKENYEGATGYAAEGLPATHPLRIGLAMNYSVFMHEMLNDTTHAHDHAKQYYDEALDELEAVRDVDGARYNECARLLALMHENIKIWTPPS